MVERYTTAAFAKAGPRAAAKRRWVGAGVLGCAMVMLLAGCYETTTSDPWIELRRFGDPRTDAKDAAAQNGQHNRFAISGYAILLKRFEGNDQQSKAQRYVNDLLASTRMRDLWFTSVEKLTYVYRGRYSDPQHPAAIADLRDTQAVVIDGEKPFANTAVVTIGVDADVAASEFDLRRLPGKFSLQIGYYDAEFGPTYRNAAETAVARLREDGEEAYFYHGPTMSMVTLGIFEPGDIRQQVYKDPVTGRDTIQPIYSDRVTALQQRFPRNVANGRINALAPDGKPPPSFLIRVPY